jgi:hypothetical protein
MSLARICALAALFALASAQSLTKRPAECAPATCKGCAMYAPDTKIVVDGAAGTVIGISACGTDGAFAPVPEDVSAEGALTYVRVRCEPCCVTGCSADAGAACDTLSTFATPEELAADEAAVKAKATAGLPVAKAAELLEWLSTETAFGCSACAEGAAPEALPALAVSRTELLGAGIAQTKLDVLGCPAAAKLEGVDAAEFVAAAPAGAPAAGAPAAEAPAVEAGKEDVAAAVASSAGRAAALGAAVLAAALLA